MPEIVLGMATTTFGGKTVSGSGEGSPVAFSPFDAPDWARIGTELGDRFSRAPIHLIPASNSPTVEELEKRFPDAQRIFAVDFYLGLDTSGKQHFEFLCLDACVGCADNTDEGYCWATHSCSLDNLASRWNSSSQQN